MGCDIHFFAEFRKDCNSPWQFLPAPPTGYDHLDEKASTVPYRFGIVDTSLPGYTPGYDNRYDGDDVAGFLRSWFDDRIYGLFAMLANVRNSWNIEPILPAPHTRGWPDDCCSQLRVEQEYIDHTPSWLTVREMLDYFYALRADERPASFMECLDEMVAAAGVDPENIRAVFYFDN